MTVQNTGKRYHDTGLRRNSTRDPRQSSKQGVEIALQEENITKNRIEQEKLAKEITVMTTEVVQRWTSLNLQQQEIEIKRIAQNIAQKELGLHEKTTEFNTSTAARIGQWTGIIGNIIRGSASISTSTVNVAK